MENGLSGLTLANINTPHYMFIHFNVPLSLFTFICIFYLH